MNDQIQLPWHFWLIGVLALLWNGFGCFDYFMTRSHNAAHLAQFPPEVIAWVDSAPLYASTGWGLGVWGALVGAILLLLRRALAVWAFVISLVGLALSSIWQHLLSTPPPTMPAGSGIMAGVIWVVAIGLLYYSWRAKRCGWLR